jgi:hypothetical protein
MGDPLGEAEGWTIVSFGDLDPMSGNLSANKGRWAERPAKGTVGALGQDGGIVPQGNDAVHNVFSVGASTLSGSRTSPSPDWRLLIAGVPVSVSS